MTRARLILRISQAHVAPGMSLAKWEAIVTKHGLALTADPAAWDAVSDAPSDASEGASEGYAGVRAIAEEIAAVVRGAK